MNKPLGEKAYSEALEAFNRNSDERSGMKQRLQTLLPPVIRHLVQQEKDCLNVLGVGCGDGEIDLEILEIIKSEQAKHSHKIKIFERAVDPNQSQLDKFQSSQKYQTLVQDGGVRIALSCATFDEYMSSCAERNTYDFVHFVLSIFTMADIEDCLVYTMEHLMKKNGRILIVMTGEDVVSLIATKQLPLRPENAQSPTFPEVINNIHDIAKKHGWRCDLETAEFAVDVAKVFDEQSHEGNSILDCFTHVQDFRSSVDRHHVEETLELMRKSVVKKVDGKCLCKRLFYYFVIYKE